MGPEKALYKRHLMQNDHDIFLNCKFFPISYTDNFLFTSVQVKQGTESFGNGL